MFLYAFLLSLFFFGKKLFQKLHGARFCESTMFVASADWILR